MEGPSRKGESRGQLYIAGGERKLCLCLGPRGRKGGGWKWVAVRGAEKKVNGPVTPAAPCWAQGSQEGRAARLARKWRGSGQVPAFHQSSCKIKDLVPNTFIFVGAK